MAKRQPLVIAVETVFRSGKTDCTGIQLKLALAPWGNCAFLTYCKLLKKSNSYTVCLAEGRHFQILTSVVTDLVFGKQCYDAIGRHLCCAPFQFCVCKPSE